MTSMINWEAARARSADAERLDSAPNLRPFVRFAALISRPRKRHR
jgi:hypothetical protein